MEISHLARVSILTSSMRVDRTFAASYQNKRHDILYYWIHPERSELLHAASVKYEIINSRYLIYIGGFGFANQMIFTQNVFAFKT